MDFDAWLQRRLIAHDFAPGPVDGEFGPKTRAALEAFQRAENLSVTGSATDDTIDALRRAPGAVLPADDEREDDTVHEPPASGFSFSANDRKKLAGVHPALQKVFKRVEETTPIPIRILEGRRSKARQRQLVARGASRTMHSKHLTGHAVDVAPLVGGRVSWDWPLYYRLEKIIKRAARDVGVDIEWGGDWKSFKDGPHWQVQPAKYPF